MYVMSSLPPSQQSLAGGIFNTVTKLCTNIGLGITTAVYNAVADSLPGDGTGPFTPSIKPYHSTYWVSAGFAGLSLFLVLFLTIGTQGDASNPASPESEPEPVGCSIENKDEGNTSSPTSPVVEEGKEEHR